jgi:hypothetical protein
MNTEQLLQLLPIPEGWRYYTILLIVVSLVPFLVKSITPVTRLCSALSEARNRKILLERLSRGSYDKETIQQSTQNYISPKCSNIDPAQEEEVRLALMATRESLFAKIDYFIDHGSTKRHLLVLADSGTGKTSFVLNYYAYNLRRRGRKSQNLLLVYLGYKDADHQLREHKNQNETIVFLDALDEDTKAIENHRVRIRELMEICRDYKRVIITCRTQFFPSDEEVPVETGVARLGPRKAGEKGVYEFWKLYLSPFDDSDINLYLQKRFPIWRLGDRKKARELAFQVKSLSARPMLLAHIPDVVKSNSRITRSYQLYQEMVDAWLDRESSWVKKSDLKEYSERLAVNLYVFRENRGMERIPYDDLVNLAHDWKINLPQWQLSGRSLLNRDAQGNYKFAHRSIMEFLFVNRLIQRDSDCSGIILSDQMKNFLIERILPEGVSQPLLNSFQFLLRNEVYTIYADRPVSDGDEVGNRYHTSLDSELDGDPPSKDTFLGNLDYASQCIYLFSRQLWSDSFAVNADGQLKDSRETLGFLLPSIEEDKATRPGNEYYREILEHVFPSKEFLFGGDKVIRAVVSGGDGSKSILVYRELFGNEENTTRLSVDYPQDSFKVLSLLNPPKEIHKDVRRFIELYGAQGLICYYVINSSGFCQIKPTLPNLDQFELILVPEQCQSPQLA